MKALLAGTFALPSLLFGAPGPSVEIDRAEAKPGDTVTVDLAAWPAGNVLIELCGNGGERGSADCAVAAAATTFVTGQGRGTAMITVVKPPIGCPCVVSARPVSGGRARTVPLKIEGVPVLTAAQRRTVSAGPARDLTVSGVRVSGGGPSAAWFAGPAERTVTFTVRNTGAAPVTDPPLTLAAGRGAEPTGILDAPKIGTLAPGEERTYEVDVTLPGPAFGRYTVVGELTGVDRPARFTAHTSSYPWALPALLALAVPATVVRELTSKRRPVRRPVPAEPVARTAAGMNEIVAANIRQWRLVRDLPRTALAEKLTSLTGTAWTADQIERAETFTPPRRFDADELHAFSRALDVPLPALFLSPTGYKIFRADVEADVEDAGTAPTI
ncbi:hypothetical protein E1287_12670 [Actinomadura sp. KC06]|uniref:hypothetical protein n=1 Tax=Actinomadura sp. KC06 TaxID=2530369 RepID=UPI00104FD03A|nr:hypothetical protein [Actinomadura sp. KC06]TDD35835.1 hypothetical protein E1287_12670 [Actinomadura sp. KC06]